jgi:hypothetical protein
MPVSEYGGNQKPKGRVQGEEDVSVNQQSGLEAEGRPKQKVKQNSKYFGPS